MRSIALFFCGVKSKPKAMVGNVRVTGDCGEDEMNPGGKIGAQFSFWVEWSVAGDRTGKKRPKTRAISAHVIHLAK